MDPLPCIEFLRAARQDGEWGEYMLSPNAENLLVAQVLLDRGFDVEAVHWSFEVVIDEERNRAGCRALRLPNGSLMDFRSGATGAEAIEKNSAELAGVQWLCSWIRPGRAERDIRPSRRLAGVRLAADQAYARQHERVLLLLSHHALDASTPASSLTPRSGARL